MKVFSLSLVTRKFSGRNNDERGFAHVRVAMVLVALMAVLEIGASGADRFFAGTNEIHEIYPTTAPFRPMTVGFEMIGPKPDRPAIVRLMDAAHRMVERTGVPYVFGGTQIGAQRYCQECSECVRKNHLPANSTLLRFNKCQACRKCGIDCSNFVNRLFAAAGLKYRFADTRTLNGMKDGFLQEQYGFINMGTDLSEARPGDLLLEKGHVMMLVDIDLNIGTIDYIHASRGSQRTPVGGIELRRGMSIVKAQRDIVRILRHRELVLPEDSGIFLGSGRSLWSDMKRLLVSNH